MSTPTRYSFRNTPTRGEGDGAYEKYFSGAIKIRGGSELRRSLFNSTMVSDDTRSVRSARTPSKKEDVDYRVDEEDDEKDEIIEIKSTKSSRLLRKVATDQQLYDSLSNRSTATGTPNRTIQRLKQQEMGAPKTPQSGKKKSGSSLVRRNTISTTPTTQKRMNSRITEKSSLNVYEQARLKLHVANTPDCLPCREKQFSDIYNFIETNLRNHTGGCMYVCGVPGTGKTLTVRQVVLCLKESVRDAVLPAFKYIEVNAFQVTEPYQIYKLIYKELTDESVPADHAVMLLEKKFELKSSEPTVLLVDELDMLCTKKQDVLYNLFDWPYKKNSKWIVVAIANAMNLPEQVMSKISSRLGLSRMNFQPYTHTELEEIVRLRLEELNVFESDAITFAARKVAAVSGDARRALEICRRATELAERDDNAKKELKANGRVNSR